MLKITSKEFQRNTDLYQRLALNESVTITQHGRENLVLISAKEYKLLRKRERTVVDVNELSVYEIEFIEKTTMSTKHKYLNSEIDEL